MEEQKITPEEFEEDLFEQEERCHKAMRTISKAIFMRLFVTFLLIWALLQTNMEAWIFGLMGFTLIINLSGIFPLAAEWRKQRKKLKLLIDKETT